jgi:nucleoside-diphosphate-sugar epimerase
VKILVTGASGFVGTHLCEHLLSLGHEVFALVRNPKKFTEITHAQLTVIKGDLDQDALPWTNLLPLDLDTCVHTAGIVHAYNTNEFYRVNSDGTENLINSLRVHFKNLHFILISSLAAAGPSLGTNKRNESDMSFPVSIYGISKKKAEEILSTRTPPSWELSAVRPPMVIGPRDSAVLDIFKMVQSRLIVMPGSNSLKKSYSFVCVFDLVETITRIIEQKKKGVFYSASPETITFHQLISEIKKQLNKNWILFLPLPLFVVKIAALLLNFFYKLRPHQVRLTPDKYHELAALNWTCDAKKSEEVLGQEYVYNLERTIKVTLIDYKSRNWL